MQPRLNLDVIYQSHGSKGGLYLPEPRAAKITGIYHRLNGQIIDSFADIVVFNPTGLFFLQKAYYGKESGNWHYQDEENECLQA